MKKGFLLHRWIGWESSDPLCICFCFRFIYGWNCTPLPPYVQMSIAAQWALLTLARHQTNTMRALLSLLWMVDDHNYCFKCKQKCSLRQSTAWMAISLPLPHNPPYALSRPQWTSNNLSVEGNEIWDGRTNIWSRSDFLSTFEWMLPSQITELYRENQSDYKRSREHTIPYNSAKINKYF